MLGQQLFPDFQTRFAYYYNIFVLFLSGISVFSLRQVYWLMNLHYNDIAFCSVSSLCLWAKSFAASNGQCRQLFTQLHRWRLYWPPAFCLWFAEVPELFRATKECCRLVRLLRSEGTTRVGTVILNSNQWVVNGNLSAHLIRAHSSTFCNRHKNWPLLILERMYTFSVLILTYSAEQLIF